VGVHGDLRGRVLGRADEDLLRGEHKVDGLAEALGIELAVLALEAHEVQAREVARGVVEAHVFTAGVAAVDAAAHRPGVPIVDRGVELHAGVAAGPRGLGDLAEELAGLHGLDRVAGAHSLEVPVLVRQRRAHEVVGRANGVVRVLELDGLPRLAVEAHVVALLAKRPGLLLFLGLAPDELAEVGVIGVEDDHLRRAPRRATRLDRAGDGVRAAHE